MIIAAIETRYKGYRFRSRLEARWAVFFDTMGIAWSYETASFRVAGCNQKPIYYLPDFFFPDIETYVEIKPFSDPSKLVRAEIEKVMALAGHGNLDILLLGGSDMATYRGTLFLGSEKERVEGAHFGLIDRLQFSVCPLCAAAGLYLVPDNPGRSIFRCFNNRCLAHTLLNVKREVDWITPRVQRAIETARSARFEHGETPKVPRGKPRG